MERPHAAAPQEVLEALQATADGLTDAEAARRRERYGLNRLAPAAPASAWRVLFSQLESVIVYLLAAAIAISLAFGDRLEAAAIAVVLAINTLLGFVTELRARRAMEALLDLDVPRAAVIRSGELRSIDAAELVPGDVIRLDTGRQVPADARLLDASDLTADEAPLTGESLPVTKAPLADVAPDAPLAERPTMVHKGTTIVTGVGRAVVTATGGSTEVGRIGALARAITLEPTPLERKLDVLGRRLVWLTLAVAGLVAGLGIFNALPLDAVIETAIALAIAAVPEALPAVATITLAVGVRRMARRQALVRRLPSVETLGSVTVVCTDKTRTLTSGDMQVVRVWTNAHDVAVRVDRPEIPGDAVDAVRALLETAARASRDQPSSADGAAHSGDPVDRAMVSAARAVGVDPAVSDESPAALLPFSSERKLMAAFFETDGVLTACAKGAPRAILTVCSTVLERGQARPIDDDAHGRLVAINDAFARDGLRVLAVARGGVRDAAAAALTDLTLIGFVGLADPPAPGVKETIRRLRTAGLRTVMLTGDQRLTAEAIGRELGVLDAGAEAMGGHDLDALPPDARDATIARQSAFSRISPEHKLTIVRALQSRGEIVAMLGDGVNDAAALKQADVGVAMGKRGTDVAKQAAAIVLENDRFETIGAAVEEGRVIFDNIRKFVFYLFSCNLAEVLVLLAAGVAGLPLPLLPLQLLWLNLATDTFPALALALEPAETDVMHRPPRRPDEALLSAAFLRAVFVYAAAITAVTLTAFIWTLTSSPAQATTMAFLTLALAQTFHLGNARSDSAVLAPRRALANPFALGAVALVLTLQVIVMTWPPLAHVLRLAPLSGRDWAVAVALALVPAVIGQIVKSVRTVRGGGRDS
jgi:Ca2+-transporting ATPase